MSLDGGLRSRVEGWLLEDPDPQTRAELADLLGRADTDEDACAELEDRFSGTLQFGTAGLRGALGAGPNRMNRVVVMRAAAGLAAYLNQRGGGAVVIGYDARHNSDVFARDTAAVLTGAGLGALVLPRPLPTPVLAFAIRELGASAGVMVTASHNPAQDNGYKVYLGDGSQIVPPTDSEISALIDAVGPLESLPLGEEWTTLGDEVLDAYVRRATSIVDPGRHPGLRVAYTPMHGVGGEVVQLVFERAGFAVPHVVGAQFEPDPDFPTVSFPNPEEPGAMDLLLAVARATDADLAVANDPDADRCAAAVRSGGDYRLLRGDEVGTLLGWWTAERARRTGASLRGVFANSIVSCSLLARVAAEFGLEHQETLTGFKWIGRIPDLRFGYEEALGYCVDPDTVKDKDGITAALLLAELVGTLKAEGRTPEDVLDAIARRHGYHLTQQLSIRVTDLRVIPETMERLRDQPPAELGGCKVERVDDLTAGVGGLPPTDGLRYWLSDGVRVIVRPSGTEPKLKCYLQVVEPAEDLPTAKERARVRMARLHADLAPLLGG